MNETAELMLMIICRIPAGSVATYGQIARLAGKPKNSRQVGAILRDLTDGDEIPWHRVVNSKGKISQRSHRPDCENEQLSRLRLEGVDVANQQVDLKVYQWDGQ